MAQSPRAPLMAQAVETYWNALARADWATMGACYSPAAEFRDPVFHLRGPDIAAMWKALMADSDVRVACDPLIIEANRAHGTWTATYTFSLTGRRVINRVQSEFVFQDGHITWQRDSFNFWRWSGQALGWRGWLLGWTPLVRRRVQRMAHRRVVQ
jgi:hypothetical protein